MYECWPPLPYKVVQGDLSAITYVGHVTEADDEVEHDQQVPTLNESPKASSRLRPKLVVQTAAGKIQESFPSYRLSWKTLDGYLCTLWGPEYDSDIKLVSFANLFREQYILIWYSTVDITISLFSGI